MVSQSKDLKFIALLDRYKDVWKLSISSDRFRFDGMHEGARSL